jgi:hypothetical protein
MGDSVMPTQEVLPHPSEQAFLADAGKAKFQNGVDKGRWRLVEGSERWPIVCIEVAALAKLNAPAGYAFRFDLTGYPEQPPTARLWDVTTGSPLLRAKWPGGKGRVTAAFNPDWNAESAIYLPCDRVALVGHDAWRQQHPHLLWSSRGDITQYLWILYDLLNSPEYGGLRPS